MTDYNPYACGFSLTFDDILICRLESLPCMLYTGRECVRKKQEESIKKISKMFKKEED